MLPNVWYTPMFYLAILFQIFIIHAINTKNSSDKLFADVIKNITRVNKVLEELIDNYENLQKIYLSKEVFETTKYYMSQTDKKTGRNLLMNKRSDLDRLPATEMIWSDERDSDDSENASENENNITMKALVKHPKTKTTGNEMLIVFSSVEGERKNISGHLPKAEVIFVDTHKNILEEEKKKHHQKNDKKGTMKDNKINVHRNKKTRFSIEPNFKQNNKVSNEKHDSYEEVNVATKRSHSKKDIDKHTTMSTAKDIVILHGTTTHNKSSTLPPLYMRTQNLDQYKSGGEEKKEGDKNSEISLAMTSNETDLTKVGKFEKAQNKISQSRKENLDKPFNFDDEEDVAFAKNEFVTNILRNAYGDACLKLVIRKCYQACKKVLTIVCRNPKCKEEFRESYDELSRTGCIQAFVPPTNDTNKLRNEKKVTTIVPTQRIATIDELDEESDDMSHITEIKSKHNITYLIEIDMENKRRDMVVKEDPTIYTGDAGYLETVCQLHRSNMPIVAAGGTTSKNISLLRSKYEKQCIKTSREKCSDACIYAYKKACQENECSEKRKRDFEKTCKRQCNLNFTTRFSKNKKDSSSSSETESSSEYDSDDK